MEFMNMVALVKRLYDQAMQPVCARHQITRMELDILLFLSNNPDFDTATDIIDRRWLTKSHVSASVKTLEVQGYLERSHQEGNRKTVHLQLLPKAQDILREGKQAQEAFFAAVFAGFTPEERKRMDTNINRVTDNVRSALTGGTEHAL